MYFFSLHFIISKVILFITFLNCRVFSYYSTKVIFGFLYLFCSLNFDHFTLPLVDALLYFIHLAHILWVTHFSISSPLWNIDLRNRKLSFFSISWPLILLSFYFFFLLLLNLHSMYFILVILNQKFLYSTLSCQIFNLALIPLLIPFTTTISSTKVH